MPENLLLETRRAPFVTSTFNRAAGTVDAILSASADVQRRDARGVFTERLDPGAITVRNGGSRVPLLNSHRRDSIDEVRGFADNIRTEGGEIRATLHVTDERTLAMIESGALTGTSIGFLPTADKWTEADGRRIRSITAASLYEASLTEFPADPNASILRSETPMEPDTTAITDRAEINRQIRNLGRTLSLQTDFIDTQIDNGATLAEVRAAALDEVIRRGVRIPVHQIGASGDDPEVIRTRMGDALANRLGAPGELSPEAVPFRGMGLHDNLRNLLAARGEPGLLSLSTERLLERATATGDLTVLLQGTGQRFLLSAYTQALSPVFALAREIAANDFRTWKTIRLGEMAILEKVAESGEVTHGGVAEESETGQLATYAKIFGLTRQALINDDLGAFSDVSAAQGRAAAATQNNLIVALLTQANGLGPVMSDGLRLFDPDHANVSVTGGAPDATTLAAAVMLMRTQTGVDGITPINATPRFLLVSPAKETAARQAVAAFYPPTAADVNPLAGTLTVAVEPRLSGNRWYLFADPAIIPVLQYAYLASAPGPQMETRAGFEVLAIEFRVLLDFGCGVTDWRGAYTNAGA